MIICLGPVCVPVSAFVPALIALAHQRGWLKWVNPQWFDYRWYMLRWGRYRAARASGAVKSE